MQVSSIIAELDAEISRLQQARDLLAGGTAKPGRGRPKGSVNHPPAALTAATAKNTKRRLSPEGRKRIAEAMKKRWAERRKQAGK